MLFFSVIFLLLVQLVYLDIDPSTIDPDDPCYYGTSYCLNPGGSTDCNADLVARVRFIASHEDETNLDYLFITVFGNYTKGPENVTLSLGIDVKGQHFNFYCSSDDEEAYKLTAYYRMVTPYEFYCNWKLIITANGSQGAPISHSAISIDLATIENNVPIRLGFNAIENFVAPNLAGTLFHQLSYHQCWIEDKMSFYDNGKHNIITLLKKIYNTEMEIFIYRLIPDEKLTDRSIKFVNANGVSLTVSCDQSFSNLSGYVQEGERKDSIENNFNFKLLDGYRCGFRLPYLLQTDNFKFNFEAMPIDFSFTSTSGSYVNKRDIRFDTDPRNQPDQTDKPEQPKQKEQPNQPEIDWDAFDNTDE